MNRFIAFGGLHYILTVIFIIMAFVFTCNDDITSKDISDIKYYCVLALFNLICGMVFTIKRLGE